MLQGYDLLTKIIHELRRHAPFTALGTVSGVVIMLLLSAIKVPAILFDVLFWCLHPLHIMLSAFVTVSMYRLNTRNSILPTFVVGYLGAVGIATLSDSVIPFAGEWLLDMPNKGLHIGFIEKWWLVNPLVAVGIAMAYLWPRTQVPHAGHVFLSTWASMFHMTMALNGRITLVAIVGVAVFLFLAVWIPCCTSDIAFPLLFIKQKANEKGIQQNFLR